MDRFGCVLLPAAAAAAAAGGGGGGRSGSSAACPIVIDIDSDDEAPIMSSSATISTTTFNSTSRTNSSSTTRTPTSAPPRARAPVAAPGGHGASGRGGHYIGPCLCSPEGCPTLGFSGCAGLPNPFYGPQIGRAMYTHPDLAIVAAEHMSGHAPGLQYSVNQQVHILPAPAAAAAAASAASAASATGGGGGGTGDVGIKNANSGMYGDPLLGYNTSGNRGSSSNSSSKDRGVSSAGPALWSEGRKGGAAIIKCWKRCGGPNFYHSWHGNKILRKSPWHIIEEDASVLLLEEEGSTGLDLSFATHIFLLERLHDPALRNQIISRAHRMGATGPVQVQLVQVKADD